MYLSKKKVILVISVSALVFFLLTQMSNHKMLRLLMVIQLKLMEKKSDLVA